MDMLERLLPSEVARLVLGYLKTEGCNSAFKAFLSECPHLKEYAMLLERGREYTTKVNGRTLEDYLDEFADLKKAVSTKTSLSQHYVNADGQVRRMILDTPAEGDKNVAPGSAFIVNDASPGPYAKNEIPNPCLPKKTVDLEKKTKHSRSKRASKQTTSILEDAWKAVSLPEKSRALSRLSSNKNTVLTVAESRGSSETSIDDINCDRRTRPKSKNVVKKILFESNEDDSCKQCTKNQKGRTARSSRRSKCDLVHGSKQTWQSTVVASASNTNKQTVPRVRLKIANSCQVDVVSSDEDENIGMETAYDAADLGGEPSDVDVDGSSCNNQETASGVGEENDNCDIQETTSPKPSTSAELPRRQQTAVKTMEPLTLEIPEVSEEPPGLHTPLKNVDVQSMMSTPSKFNDTASVISVGRSPKRKSHAPKRRLGKPPVSRPAAIHSFINDESLYSFPFPVDDPVSVDMSSIVKNLLENTQLQEKLAENINQVVASHNPVNTTHVAQEPCGEEETVQPQQSLENFLGTKESFVNEHVNEETIGGIVDLTKDDPAFDALFSLFNVEKDVFQENRRRQQMSGAPPENHCDVNGNLKAPAPELSGKDLSGDNTLLDRLDAMVSLADNAPSSHNEQGTHPQSFDATTEGCDAEVVYVLNIPSPQSEIVVQSNVCQLGTYAEVDQPDNVLIASVNIASVSKEKTVSCSHDKVPGEFPVRPNPNTRSSETHDLSKSGIANSSDESVRHFSRELMDLKSPYISHTNSPAPIDVDTPCESRALPKKVHSDGAEAFPRMTVPNSSPATNPLNTSMEFTACSDKEDNCVEEGHHGGTAQETRSLNQVPEVTPEKPGACGGQGQDSGMKWKLEVLELGPAPANVECSEFSSVSFESDHSKNADELRLSTKDASFTKPQTVGHNSAKPRRVPLTTLSNVPSPATPADGQNVGQFGASSVPSPFLQGPFSPQTPMMPRTPSHGMASPSQSPRETSAPFSSFSSQSASSCTMAHGRTFVLSPAPEASTSKPTAPSPVPSLYARPTDSPRTAKPCPSPLPASLFQPRCFSTSVPSPFMCHPVSPRTPGMVPPASPVTKEGTSLEQGSSPLIPVTSESDPELLKHSSSSVEPTSGDPAELLSMTAEFSPSQPQSTSSPATPVRNKKSVTSSVPFVVNRTPDKAVAGIKLVASLASPRLSQAVQHVMTSRMTPDKLAAASNQLLKMQRATPDKQVHITPGKEQTLDNYLTPNKGPPSVGSCLSNHSPYNALRMTPVQTTDEDYSQHQNLAVASIMPTPQKGSKHSSDNEEDISNESDETCMSVATVVREEQRQAVDAILQPSPAKSTCATPQKVFYRNRGTPVKSNSPSPNISPQNFTKIVSKERPVIFKIPNVEKDCPSPLKDDHNDNQLQKKVIGNENVQTLSETLQTCEFQKFTESGQDVRSPKHSSVVQSKGKGGSVRMQVSNGKIADSENSFCELNHSNSTGLPSDGDAAICDQEHAVMMESLSSETISAFQAYAESIPGVGRTTASGETTQINITTNFGLLPQNQPVSCPTSQYMNTSSGQIVSAQVAASASQEMTSAFTQQELDDERALLAEVHSTLASMPPLPDDQPAGSTTPVTSSQNEDIPLSAGAMMGFSAAQEQMYSTPVSEPDKVFVQSPQYQQCGSKKKKHSRTSSVSEVGTPPAPSYRVPIPSSINLQDPGVRVIQVKTQKGNVIPIFLTPLDSFDQSTAGEQQLSSDQGSSPPLKVIPVEVKDIASPEARMLLQDSSQSFDTVFGSTGISGKSSFIGNVLSSQKDITTPNEAEKTNTEEVVTIEAASQALVTPSTAQVSESGSSANTSPDMAKVKGSRLHQEGMSAEGVVELSKTGNRRKRKKKLETSETEAKKRRTDPALVDDCDNVELLDFLQAHPVGDLCKKTISPQSPHTSVTGSPGKTPANVESYKFCSPAPVGEQTQDGGSSIWHDIVNIDLGEQTNIMANITRPLSELLRTPTKSATFRAHGTPSRSQHTATQSGPLADLLKTPNKPEIRHSHGTPRSQHAGTPSRLNSESNSSVNFSPARGKLRPILESCSIIDNHVVASPSMSLDPDSDVDPDEFLQRLPQQIRNLAKTTKLNKQSGHSSSLQSQPKLPTSSSAADIVTVESTEQSHVPPKETCTSPIELAATESGIFPNVENQQSYRNDQVSCSTVLTPPVNIAPAVSQSSVQSAPVIMPANSSTCSFNLSSIQPAQPVQPSVILVQLPNGQYAVLPTSALAPAAPVVVPPATTTAEPVRWKRKYKQRKKKSPSQTSKKTTPPAAPVQNTTRPAMNQVVQALQIPNFSQPSPVMPQVVQVSQPTAVQTLTQPAPIVVQQVPSTRSASCSTKPVTQGQPVPGVTQSAALNEPNLSMMSPTELVIAETPPYVPEHEKEETIRKISPGLDALIRMASPKKDSSKLSKSTRSSKASTKDRQTNSHGQPRKTVQRMSEISPQKRTGIAQRSTFSPLVAAAMEYQQMKKKELQSPARDVPLADADVSMDMPSEDIFLGLESNEQSSVKKPADASENTSKHSTCRVSNAPFSSSTESGAKLTGAKSKIVSKKKKASRRTKKEPKPDLTSPVLPPESVISNMQGSQNEVVICIPNNATPTIDTEMFSSLLRDGSDDDSGKEGKRAAKRGRRKQKRQSSSQNRSPTKSRQTSSVRKAKEGPSQPARHFPKVSATLQKKSSAKAKQATQGNLQQIKKQASARQAAETIQTDENRGDPSKKPQDTKKTVAAMLKSLREEKPKAKTHVRVLHFSEVETESPASKSKRSGESVQQTTAVDQDLHEIAQENGTSGGLSGKTSHSESHDEEMVDDTSAVNSTVFRDPKLNAKVEIHVSRLGKDKKGNVTPVTDKNNSDSDDLGPLPIPRRRSSKAEKSESRNLNVQAVPEVVQTLEVEKMGRVLEKSSSSESRQVTKSGKHSRLRLKESSSKDKVVGSSSAPKEDKAAASVSSSKTKDKVTASSSKSKDKIASGSSKSKDIITASSFRTKDKVTASSSISKDRISVGSSKEHGLSSKSIKVMKAKKSKKKGVVELDRETLDALCKAAGLDLGKFASDSSGASDQDDEAEMNVAEDTATVESESESESENEHDGDERSNFLLDLKTPAEKVVKNRASVEKAETWVPENGEVDSHVCDSENVNDNSFSSAISTTADVNITSSKKQMSSSKVVSIGELKNRTTCNSNEVLSSRKLKKLSVGAKGDVMGDVSLGVKKRSPKLDSARTLVKKSDQKLGDKCRTSVKKSVHKVHVVATDTKSDEACHNESASGRVQGKGATEIHLDAVLDSVVRSKSKDSDCFQIVCSPKKSKMQLSSLDDVFNSVIVTSPENPTRKKVEGSVYRVPADLVSKFRQKTSGSKSSKSSKVTLKLPAKSASMTNSNSTFKSNVEHSTAHSSRKSALSENSQSRKASTGQTPDAKSDKGLQKSSKTGTRGAHGLKSGPEHIEHSNKISDPSRTVMHSSIRKTKPSPRSQIRMDFEEIFGDESPPKDLQKGGKNVPSLDSQGKPLPRKSPRKRPVTNVAVPSNQRSPKKRSPKKKDHKTSGLVSSSTSKSKKGSLKVKAPKSKKTPMKVKVPNFKIVMNKVIPEDCTSVPCGESTPKVYSPQLTPEKYFPMDISPDRSPEKEVKSEIDSDEAMEINAAETLVSMAMSITPQKSSSASNSRSPGFPVNVNATPQKEDNLDSYPDYLPDLAFSSTVTSQPVFPTSTQTLTTTCSAAFTSDDAQAGLVFKTPEKPRMTETTRRTPRKGTPRKLLVMNQDPLSDLKKKDRDLFERKVPKSPAKAVSVKTSKKHAVKRLSPRKHSKVKKHQ